VETRLPEAFLSPLVPVKPVTNAKVLTSYEEAFYSVSEAYIKTMERIRLHNENLLIGAEYLRKDILTK